MAGQVNFTSASGIMFALMAIPFAIDALVGLTLVYQKFTKSSEDYVCAEMVEEIENRKLFPESI